MISKFVNFVEEKRLGVNSIIVTSNGQRYQHCFKDDSLTNIRSISKVVSCLGAYMAIKAGLYDLDTYVMPFFDDVQITNESNQKHLKNLQIKHLLSLTIGHEVGLMFSKNIKNLPPDTDFVSYILNYDIPHKPGTFFVYNNAATYLLCALTQKLSSMYFGDWVKDKLFTQLQINDFEWEKSTQGICLGASGLYLKNNDLHKIALLLLDNGNYNGKQIVEPGWIKKMHTPQIITADLVEYSSKQGRCINKMAYGYNLWISGDGSFKYPKEHYFCDGTDGQFLIISSMRQMAITVLSHQKDMNPFYEIFNTFFE